MRHVLTLTICGALATPFSAFAQPAPDVPVPETPIVAEAPAQEPPVEAVAPEAGPAPDEVAAPPTTVQSITVEAEDKDKKKSKLGKKAAVTAGGVIGGLAGAAGGPVGKIAGSLVGKTIAKTVVGGDKKDKKDEAETEVAQAAAPPATNAVAVTDTPALGDPAPVPQAEPVAAAEADEPPTR